MSFHQPGPPPFRATSPPGSYRAASPPGPGYPQQQRGSVAGQPPFGQPQVHAPLPVQGGYRSASPALNAHNIQMDRGTPPNQPGQAYAGSQPFPQPGLFGAIPDQAAVTMGLQLGTQMFNAGSAYMNDNVRALFRSSCKLSVMIFGAVMQPGYWTGISAVPKLPRN
jgi:hypothetical protein